MDLRHLRYIVASARNGSFSAAAAYEFNVRQPIVSKRIKEAEVELKVKLFDRSTAGARLTPAGEDFVVVARRIIEDFDRMAQHARVSGAGTVGRVVVGFYQSLSAGAFHAAVSDFRKRYPEIEAAGRGFVQLWASPRCAANFPRLDNLRLLRGLITRRPPQGRVGGPQHGGPDQRHC